MRIRSPYSYYGGKSKLASRYPAPLHNLIIEPFAGSGAYSWLHRRDAYGNPRQVWLNDLDPKTYSIWQFLTSPTALDIVEKYVPDTVTAGVKVSELIPAEFPGLVEICRAEANQGTQGARGVHDQVTTMGAKCWKVKRKLREVIPEVAGWWISQLDYADLNPPVQAVRPWTHATWFIDPPYANNAGKRYRQSAIDYAILAAYCQSRKGQVIVAENVGATWLDFQPMEHPRVSIRSRYQRANAQEALWYRENQ